MERGNMTYPYLGIKIFDDGDKYVVLFTEPGYGVIVMNETNNKNINFGDIKNFDEETFSVLPQEQYVRLNN